MSNLDDVRAAENKMKALLEKLRLAVAPNSQNLHAELNKATDEYEKVVRDLFDKR